MFVVNNRKIFYIISVLLIVTSFAAMARWGFSFGIDFTGGTAVELVYPDGKPEISVIRTQVDSLAFEPSIKGAYTVVPVGENGYALSLRTVTDMERAALEYVFLSNSAYRVEIKKFNSIGPTLGKEAAKKSLVSIFLVVVVIMLFLTFAFRKVSHPVSSWKYGMVTLITLIHDLILPIGAFVILNQYFYGFEINTLFITALLVILGFSVHDTIVVFDRIRENLRTHAGSTFSQIVGMSVSQTFARSVNTSLTTLFAILVVYLVGPEATKAFSLALTIGIFFGTYSSIFIGSNLLVTLEEYQRKSNR